MFNKTVSAISSALCPVATLSTFNNAAPRSRAFNKKESQTSHSIINNTNASATKTVITNYFRMDV